LQLLLILPVVVLVVSVSVSWCCGVGAVGRDNSTGGGAVGGGSAN
jgi:hypothetical protein